MQTLLVGFGVLLTSGVAALAAGRRPDRATRIGVVGAVVGCALGLVPAIDVLVSGHSVELNARWSVPGGSFRVGIDQLSAFFLLPLLVLSALCAVYGGAYLRAHGGHRSPGPPWFFFNVLVASMGLVVVARNAVLFLVAWEVMAVASFFLVTFEHERESVRKAGWTYLVASHLGTAFLLPMFALLGLAAGTLDFDGLGLAAGIAPSTASLVFVLAVVGFGTKAGWVPFHVWLPEAHPAAPSHVSALMSGVLVKLGIYGILRTIGLLAPLHTAWWGWLLIAIGGLSMVYGILYALGQTDLKRMLAYSTVENTGLIAMGLGLGVVGHATGHAQMAWLGFAGALLHVLNHAVFKGVLFLGAGAVLHATGTTEMDRLGGLARRMPWTAAAFFAGVVAITALPPTNGFVSEFLLLLGAYSGLVSAQPSLAGPVAIAVVALVAGLVALAFTRAFGVVFLGVPRDSSVPDATEPPAAMRIPMLLLAAATVILGIGLPWILSDLTRHGLPVIPFVDGDVVKRQVWELGHTMRPLTLGLAAFAAGLALVAVVRWRLLARRAVSAGPTWGCGYARPSPRMQYTASSFAEPLLSLFSPLVRRRTRIEPPHAAFPRTSSLEVETVDPVAGAVYAAPYAALGRGLGWFRWLQQGRVQLYVLYIAATLVALLLWTRGWAP